MSLNQRLNPEMGIFRWLAKSRERLAANAENGDNAPFLPLYISAVLYFLVAAALSVRPLWFDELFTYYIAKSPTPERFFSALTKCDLNPPLQYALTMLTFRFVGDSDLATRIPSIVGFWIASVCLYKFVGYRLGRFYGWLSMLALWSTAFFVYAVEARPYALMTAFLGIAMVSWQRSEKIHHRVLCLFGIGTGICGVLLSHIFGSVSILPLGIAEIVRSVRRRELDWGIWIAFTAPAPCLLIYWPTVAEYGNLSILYPPEFQASLLKAITFYGEVMSGGSVVLLIALAAGLYVSNATPRESSRHSGLTSAELALGFSLLLVPFAIDLLLIRSGGAFWPRYGIVSGLGIGLLFAQLLGRTTQMSRVAAAVAARIILLAFVIHWAVEPRLQPKSYPMTKQLKIHDLDPNLPVVAASGLTFVEMNKREDSALLSRVYYLTDRGAAVRYAHATIFETFGSLQRWFPIRARVMPYRAFKANARHFLVLCSLDYPEDWLIPKLMDDGADLRFLGEIAGYRTTMIFEASFPLQETHSSRGPREVLNNLSKSTN